MCSLPAPRASLTLWPDALALVNWWFCLPLARPENRGSWRWGCGINCHSHPELSPIPPSAPVSGCGLSCPLGDRGTGWHKAQTRKKHDAE